MKKPNIIFILIDDMGFRDLQCLGSTFYETPNIDRLQREGMCFTNAYASCPVCSPSRASALTGKYPATVGVTDWIDTSGTCHPVKGRLIDVPYLKYLPHAETTIASALKEKGYTTWHVGKWHLGTEEYYPEHHGFDVNIGGCHKGHPSNGYFSPYNIENLEEGIEGEYLTDRLTDEALTLIRGHHKETPFFLNLWHYTVHTPIEAKPEHILKFEEKVRELGLDKIDPFVEGDYFPIENKKNQRIRRRLVQSDPTYAAMIYSLDENIGRLMDGLEASGEIDNTLIVFTSDNGGLSTAEGSPTCNLPAREGKGWMYDGGVRVPMLAWYPKMIKKESLCNVPVTSTDFYPTFLDIAGAMPMPEQHCDGESLVGLFTGKKELEREAIFWHYPHYGNQGGTPGSAIRYKQYKLIEFFETGEIELYDLEKDMSELKDIKLEVPHVATYMHDMLKNWRECVEAKIPQPNPGWKK